MLTLSLAQAIGLHCYHDNMTFFLSKAVSWSVVEARVEGLYPWGLTSGPLHSSEKGANRGRDCLMGFWSQANLRSIYCSAASQLLSLSFLFYKQGWSPFTGLL